MSQKGLFRRRIDIQYQKLVSDAAGEPQPTWTTRYEAVPCGIEPWRGRETFAAQQVLPSLTWKITFNYLPDVEPQMRAVEYLNSSKTKFRIFNIESVSPDATGMREILMLCEERFEDGMRSDGR